MLRSPAPRRGSRAHALAGPGARRPGPRRSGGRSRRCAGQPAPDPSQDGLPHRLRYGWRAGGRAGGAWEPNRHPGKLRGSVMVCEGCQGGSRTLGLRDPHPHHPEDAWEPGGGYLPVESGDPKRLTFGSLGSPEKFQSLEFLQGTRGVRSCLGFEPWTWGTCGCSEAALSLPDLGQVI